MAVEVEVAPPELVVRFQGWDRVWALRGRAYVQLEHIVGVQVEQREDAVATLGFRIAGSWIPRVLAAGLFRRRGGGRQLWCVHRSPRVLAIDLRGARWDRIVLEVPDPTGTAAVIEAAARDT